MKKLFTIAVIALTIFSTSPADALAPSSFGDGNSIYISSFAGSPSESPNGEDSGVYLLTGQSILITASGEASCSYSNYYACAFGPDGKAGEFVSTFIAPTLPAFSLIGRVGTSGSWTFIGAGPMTFTAQSDGEFFLAYNDDIYGDNLGGFDVVLTNYISPTFTRTSATCQSVVQGSEESISTVYYNSFISRLGAYLGSFSVGSLYLWRTVLADSSTVRIYGQSNDSNYKVMPGGQGSLVFNNLCQRLNGPKVVMSRGNSVATLTNATVGTVYFVAVRISPARLVTTLTPSANSVTYKFMTSEGEYSNLYLVGAK